MMKFPATLENRLASPALRFAALGLVLAIAAVSPRAGDSAPARAKAKLVRTLAGITLGDDRKRVEKMYGPGYFTKMEGHTGGLYYLDPTRGYLLHAVLGVDARVEQLEFSRITVLPSGVDAKSPTLVSTAVNGGLTADYDLALGKTMREVRENFSDWTTRIMLDGRTRLLLSTDNEKDPSVANYEAFLEFENDRLVKISIYNGC